MLKQAQKLAPPGAGQGEPRSTSWIIFLLKRNCELACRRRSASPQRVSRSASATPAAAASCASSFPVCASTGLQAQPLPYFTVHAPYHGLPLNLRNAHSRRQRRQPLASLPSA